MSVLVGLGEVVDIVGCCMKNLDFVLGEGPLDLVRGAAQVQLQEGDQRRYLTTGLTMGVDPLLAVMCTGVLGLVCLPE